MKNPFKVVKNKIMDKVQGYKDDKEKEEKLQKWENKLERALEKHNDFRNKAASWDAVYNGTKEVGGVRNTYVSNRDRDKRQTKDARQVVNITLQLIEAQINPEVPTPRVDALELEDQDKKDMIEGMLTYMSTGPELMRLTSLNERIVKKNSYAVFKVMYNPDYNGHTFRGRIEITNPHPSNIVPQPGIHRVADMDYLFHIENRTLEYICRRYGEEFRDELDEEAAEFGYLEDMNGSTQQDKNNNMLSVVECWYKDKDGDVCLLTWCNDTILKDEPKFYYKRDEQGNPIEVEEVDIQEQQIDTMGQSVIGPDGQPLMQQNTVSVQCHVPKSFPFVIWYNIPKEKSFYAKSDVEIISDQQETIKKLLSIEEEKQIKGTTKIFCRKGSGLKDKLTDSVSQVLETDDPVNDVVAKDLKTPDGSLKDLFLILKESAKEVLGVTDAYQGQLDNKQLSGRAIQQLSQNTQARVSVKSKEKEIAFIELYRILYDFLLAFYDEKVPYRLEGADNKPKFGYFDKGLLVKKDAAGEYYYPDFDIYISSDAGITRDKNQLLQSSIDLAVKGILDPVELWTILEYLGYPNASAILDMEKEKQQIQQQQAMEQQQQVAAQQQDMKVGLQKVFLKKLIDQQMET